MIRTPDHRARENPRLKAKGWSASGNLNKCSSGARLLMRGVCSSVANLDAGSIPNAPIPVPNWGASGPIAFGCYVDGSGRNVNRRRLIVARAARYRCSKQCTHCQATNNAGGYLTAPCDRSPGCKCQTKTACDQQTDQKLAHFGPLRMPSLFTRIEAKLLTAGPDGLDMPSARRQFPLRRHHGSGAGEDPATGLLQVRRA
jgi:hypothetical protein